MNKSANTIVSCCLSLLFLSGAVFGNPAVEPAKSDSSRYIQIDLPEVFKRFDMPFALFNHELHTKKYAKPDCGKCHRIREDGSIVYRVVDYDKKDTAAKITEGYHKFCKQCHDKSKSAPLTCKECHSPLREFKPSQWTAPELTLKQHEKVRLYIAGKCGACHHGYVNSKKAKQSGFEFSCRACHLAEQSGKTPSMEWVAHEKCITCHIKTGGPADCSPCHTGANAAEDAVADMRAVQRLDAGQKDVEFIHVEGATQPGVSFDHKDHEQNIRSCRTCHHKDMRECDVCHTLSGSKDGGDVITPEAFMGQNSQHSCIGCHERQKKKNKTCAYCHSTMAARFSDNSCPICHTGRVAADNDEKKSNQKPIDGLPATLPDSFVVGKGVKNFEPVEFPHSLIIRRLSEGIAGSHLATTFHNGKNVVCGKCHHKSNDYPTFEKCSTCHPPTGDKDKKSIVPISVALKTLCAECHTGKNKAR